MTNPIKAANYLKLLEDARCEGKWDQVTELVRKVRKHANDRACLTAAAETEFAVIRASQKLADSTLAAPSPFDLDTGRLFPKLLEAINAERTYPEDKFQAQVCLAWAHWTLGEYDHVSARLPTDQEKDLLPFKQPDGVSEWTRVCVLKAMYLKADSLTRNEKEVEAIGVYEGAMASLSHLWSGQKGRAQLQFWAELTLAEYCMMQTQTLDRGDKGLADFDALTPFRSWAKYWEVTKTHGTLPVGSYGFHGVVPRRKVWNEYYSTVSSILQMDFPFPAGYVSDGNNGPSARYQLYMELKKVETAYEDLLLSETTFPRADEQRQEIENFVAAVMRNWRISFGREWLDSDLGPAGKEGLSRGILDILYRAATKTYHSTAILRHLFTIHLSVAEFDLAFHALDSYIEIVKKGKARVDKTGDPEPSLDDDATILETISKAIIALCRYGFQDTAEKARDLGIELEELLQKSRPPLPKTGSSIPTVDEENGNGMVLHPRVPSRINALSWQAIGLSQAHWSRITSDTSVRTDLQTHAIRSLQKSLSPETGNPTDVKTLFTLSLLLAEQRELTAAIDIVKAALMSRKRPSDQRLENNPYWHERSLVPLWHLLALLLSARQDYTMAARACEAVFEQFNDPDVLFGPETAQGSFRSEHLNEAEGQNEKPHSRGLIDEMDDLEKEGILEVKMTQLALLELLEGPEAAVNASQELLVMYARLFGPIKTKVLAVVPKSPSEPPKSATGTLRSIKGSIFSHRSEKRLSHSRRRSLFSSEKSVNAPDRPQTTAGHSAPGINIEPVKENGVSPRSARPTSVRGRRSESMRRNSLKKPDGGAQPQRARSSSGAPREPELANGEAYVSSGQQDYLGRTGGSKSISTQQFSKGRGLAQNGFHMPVSDLLQSPNPLPMIKFSEEQTERQRLTILIKVWLKIASFYRCSKMHSDAKDAICEAEKLADCLGVAISRDTSGCISPSNPGWGGKICLAELSGDINTQMGLLAIDEGTPYIAKTYFEEALMLYPDHPSAIVGLSNILLDIYSEVLLPPPAIPSISGETSSGETANSKTKKSVSSKMEASRPMLAAVPLGLRGETFQEIETPRLPTQETPEFEDIDGLPAPHKATSLPLLDRLSARDRAYGLLSGLTKLGRGWNYSDAWFALARAHEESGQIDKAKDALWWCVELEEGMGVRDWHCVGVNGYAL